MSNGPKRLKDQKKADAVTVLRIEYDGETYEIPADPAKIPVGIRRELWVQSEGVTFQALAAALSAENGDDFFMVPFLFLGRRMAGERVKYKAFEQTFDVSKVGDVEVVNPAEDDSPEA
jgi:hypothetical protein